MEDRISELEAIEKNIQAQLDELNKLRASMKAALAFKAAPEAVAAA